MTRFLGPEQFGKLNYSQSFVYIFSAFVNLGLDSLLVKEFVESKYDKNEILGTAFILRILGSLISLVGVISAIFFLENKNDLLFLILIFAVNNFFQLFTIIDYYFQSIVESKYIVWANIITLILSNLLKALLIVLKSDLYSFAFVFIFESIVLSITFIYQFNKKTSGSIFKWHFKLDLAKSLLKNSWTLIISGLFVTIYFKVDQLIIKHLINVREVGFYSAAVRLSEIWYFVPIIISNTFFPSIIRLRNSNYQDFLKKIQSLFSLLIWIAILLASFVSLTGRWIIDLLYGPEFSTISSVLIIHIWTGVFVFFGVAWSNWMVIENHQKTMMKIQICSLITNVVLNFLFIPKWGIDGSAFATLISYAIGHIFFALFFKDQQLSVLMFWKSFNPFNIFSYLKDFKIVNNEKEGKLY
jgi:O-antigen/teichoic acid export membrane protein